MLASQLCVFDDKTDSISKWVKKNSVLLCCANSLFCIMISISDALIPI